MLFDFIDEILDTPELYLSYHLTPWDQSAFQANTATISSILVRIDKEVDQAFAAFRDWCILNGVKLVSCRLSQDRLIECAFLERQGFRFIELNYRPSLAGLDGFKDDPEITICDAVPEDAAKIVGFAAEIFCAGRLHVDPQVDSEVGNRRYAAWVNNAFEHPGQRVLKCLMDDRIVAFMVVEQPTPSSRFWSLVGLAPGLAGQGIGRRVWKAMLAFHHREGVMEICTSISSHNIAAHNLYVSLGFRFPTPMITLHWCPFGPVTRSVP